MPVSDWTISEDWDYLYLAGKRVPGVANVSATIDSGIKTNQPKGAKYATKVDTGCPPVNLNVELELLPEEFQAFERDIIPLFRPQKIHEPRNPLEVAHPEARAWGVGAVLTGQIDSSHPTSGGTKKVRFTLEEYRKPEPLKDTKDKKPKNDDEEGWNVQPLIDAARPARSGAAQENF
jgi:hypothetical protein